MMMNLVAIAGVPAMPARRSDCVGFGESLPTAEQQRTFSWLAAGFFLAGAALGYYLVQTERA